MAGPSTQRLSIVNGLCCLTLLLAFNAAASVQAAAPQAGSNSVPHPVIERARTGPCVADPAFMRRNHMKLLTQQRDDTLRSGDRSGKYSLKACVACHASPTSRSVNAESSNFCQSCHNYAAVKIDCFECHANQPADSVAPQQVKP